MPKKIEDLCYEWFIKAEDDELSINAIIKEQGAPSTVCFLSQQMAEKYLKGLLVFHKKKFPKVHDLLTLETLLLEVEAGIRSYEHELDLLNRYYIETRYPGEHLKFTWQEAKGAFKSALKIKEFVLNKVK